ncbi:putative leucine-rich repeat domain superfamily [Helianthus annuus]|nr:putative leucine-rich repeat domain superfamily [Helianthus annuus]
MFDLDHPPTFDGLGSLGSLYLHEVKISTKHLLHLLSNYPSLKCFSLDIGYIGELDGECTINELLRCLPVIERLTISIRAFQWLVLDPVPQELPTSLIHLKYLRLEGMCIDEDCRLAFHVLIKCSPNLERFELLVYGREYILLLRQGPIYELTLQLSDIWESSDKCTINELLKCLPAIEHLTTSPRISEWVVLDSVPQELPTSLIHLRYLCFKDMTLVERCGLAFLLVFIKCSPNLEKVKLEVNNIIIFHMLFVLIITCQNTLTQTLPGIFGKLDI